MNKASSSLRALASSLLPSLVAFSAYTSYVDAASAQELVSPSMKGIVGGALLGADVVVIGESLFGVKPAWAYFVGAGVGAVGGGIGGYFLEDSVSDGRVPSYLLAGGLALSIPAVVLALNASRYVPEETQVTDKPRSTSSEDAQGARSEGGVNAAGVQQQKTAPSPDSLPQPSSAPPPAPAAPPQSLFDIHQGTFRLGVPVPDVRPVYSLKERLQYGMAQQTEVRLPVVSVKF